MGRTLQIQNDKGELVCYAQKSVKALISEAALGSGARARTTRGAPPGGR
jgi:hypothetical protein